MEGLIDQPGAPRAAEARVAKALADCEGDKDAALLLLAHLLNNALRGSSAGICGCRRLSAHSFCIFFTGFAERQSRHPIDPDTIMTNVPNGAPITPSCSISTTCT